MSLLLLLNGTVWGQPVVPDPQTVYNFGVFRDGGPGRHRQLRRAYPARR